MKFKRLLAGVGVIAGIFTVMVVSLLPAAPVTQAAGSYDNARIADIAKTYEGKKGGQCRSFVNKVVKEASGGSQDISGADPNRYFTTLEKYGERITDINKLVKGDVVQVGQGGHTFIIWGRNSSGKFQVVDSNHSPDKRPEIVQYYERKAFSLSDTTRAYRLGKVGGQAAVPESSKATASTPAPIILSGQVAGSSNVANQLQSSKQNPNLTNTSNQSSAPAATPKPTPAPIITPEPAPAAPPTWNETAGTNSAKNTWTNYGNAGGQAGQQVGAGQTIQVYCRVEGHKVANGNPWWYRIASGPWNGQYYVSADAFYNNGSTSGSLKNTPFFDPSVPTC
jgi:hypothetical protein